MRARELLRRLEDDDLSEATAAGVAERIAALVRTGALPAGVELPSERDLASALDRSRGTIARAYERLRADGLAYTRQGARTTIGCCAGPWASSRAAELAPIVARDDPGPLIPLERLIDLREPRWRDAPLDTVGSSASSSLAAQLAAHLAEHGLPGSPEQLLLTDGHRRALDVVLTSLLRPGDRILVPALTDPSVLALLWVRGFHPVALPVDPDGRADLPGWLRRIRDRRAGVALVAATHAPPAGSVLPAHERQLLVEEAARADVTLVDDLSAADLWLEDPPSPPLAALETAGDQRIITIGSTDALTAQAPPIGWIRAPAGPVSDRLVGVRTALDAAPNVLTTAAAGAAFADRARVLRDRRQHLAELVVTAIRLVTPVAPRITVAPPEGGPRLWVRFQGLAGTEVVDLARQRGLLLRPGADCAVDGQDHPAVALALTADTEEVIAGLRILVRVAGAPLA